MKSAGNKVFRAREGDYPTGWRSLSGILGVVPRATRWVVVLCMVLATFAEGIGIAALLPLLAVVDRSSAPSGLTERILRLLDGLGLPSDPVMLSVIFVAGLIVKAALMILAMRYVGRISAGVATQRRLALIERLLAVRWTYFTSRPVGWFSNAMGHEARRASEAFLAVATLLSNVFGAAIYLIAAALLSWQVAILAAIVGITMIFSLGRLVKIARRAGRQQMRTTKSLTAQLTDTLIGLKGLKAMSRHHVFARLFVKDIDKLDRSLRTQVLARQATRLLQEPILAVFISVGMVVAVNFWQMPLTELIFMGLLLAKTVSTVGKIEQAQQQLAISEASFWSLQTLIEDVRENREVVSGVAEPTLERSIELSNVEMAYGSRRVLKNVSMSIEAGRITTITGLSGAGKTTIADLILRLTQPNSGDILIDGVSLAQINVERWRRMVGYVPQEVLLLHDSVLVNVTLGEASLSREDAIEALRAAGAGTFIESLPEGVDHIVGERGQLLSGGQRQRIAVARALVHRPKLLILDEATSALDPATEAEICRNIVELSRRTALTVLAISHQPAWIHAADKVWQVHQGEVVELPGGPGLKAIMHPSSPPESNKV